MNPSLPSRSGLLALVALLHAALLWALATGFSSAPLTPPAPLPAVMVEMLTPTPPAPKPVVQPQAAPPAPPKPVAKPQPPKPQPQPKKAAPAPAERAPSPLPAPAPAAAAAPAPTPAPAAPSAPPVAAAAPAAAPAPAPAPLVMPTHKAAYLNNPLPVYPAMLRRAGEEGKVVLKVLVTAEGTAGEVQVLRPSSHPQFDEAALAAVRKWRFTPARRGDTPVAMWYDVPVEFKLVN